jgi:hypothetical protein
MLKLLFLACVVVVSAFEHDGKPTFYSFHTGFTPGTLSLTTGELKLFSGHAMNMVRSKCPNVDAKKIFQVQKYLGKLLAKKDPKKEEGKSKEFQTLLETLTTCTNEGVNQKSSVESVEFDGASHYPGVFHHRLQKVFIHPPFDNTPPEVEGVDAGLIKDRDSSSEPPRVISTTIFIRPKDMQEGIRNSGGFFGWIRNIFSSVGGFFGNIFGGHHVSKREVMPEMQEAQAPVEVVPLNGDENTALAPYQVFTPTKDNRSGKQLFGLLIDNLCRVYCDACTGKKEVRLFKLAAKKLLEDLFEDDSGIDAAAHMMLDADFLKSIAMCN